MVGCGLVVDSSSSYPPALSAPHVILSFDSVILRGPDLAFSLSHGAISTSHSGRLATSLTDDKCFLRGVFICFLLWYSVVFYGARLQGVVYWLIKGKRL